MKKFALFHAFLIIFFCVLFINCRSTPNLSDTSDKPINISSDKLAGNSSDKPDSNSSDKSSGNSSDNNLDKNSPMWDLLAKDDDGAKNYFLGQLNPQTRDAQGRNTLHYAAENGNSRLVEFFISIGADTNALDNSNMSPLGISAQKNYANIAEMLVKAGANIHLPLSGNTSAALIALNGQNALFKSLLTPSSIVSVDAEKRNILHLAVIAGNITAVNTVLSNEASRSALTMADRSGLNPLDYAFSRTDSKRHMEIAELLILAGSVSRNPIYAYFAPAVRNANFNIRRDDGLAPIHYAVNGGYSGMLEYLYDKRVDVNAQNSSGSTPLHDATRKGNIEFLKSLIAHGANVDSKDAKGNSVLHMGIPVNAHSEAISVLIENNANLNIKDEHGESPLHILVYLNRPVSVVQTLLGGGCDIHIRNIEGKTPLYIAVQEKRMALIPLLLSYGSEVFAADNEGVTPFDLSFKDMNVFKILTTSDTVLQNDSAGNTMLHAAIRNWGNSEHINYILNQRALVDARNRMGDTALHIAVRLNQSENGEYLISRGANIFMVNSAGESPLFLALTAPEGIRRWIINAMTINAKDGLGNNMLHYAAQWRLNNAIPLIISSGVPVDGTNVTGETPLFMAVKTDSPSTALVLLENKANLQARDSQGNNTLHSAVRWNAKHCAALLIVSGIDMNAHSLSGNTPLHDAIIQEMTDIEMMLINEGANLEARDSGGNTPLMTAIGNGFVQSMERLASAGADPNTRNIQGDTPLHIAVSMERYDLIGFLLRMGTSIHARNTRGRTPYRIALSMSPRIVSILLTKDRINSGDDQGNTALHIALLEGASLEIVRTIIDQGIRINSVDSRGMNALRLALELNNIEYVKLLADLNSDPFLTAVDNRTPADVALQKGLGYVNAVFSGKAINAKDSSANTILHFAARSGTPEIISLLMELGANKYLKNIAGEIPLDIAMRWNRPENMALLK